MISFFVELIVTGQVASHIVNLKMSVLKQRTRTVLMRDLPLKLHDKRFIENDILSMETIVGSAP